MSTWNNFAKSTLSFLENFRAKFCWSQQRLRYCPLHRILYSLQSLKQVYLPDKVLSKRLDFVLCSISQYDYHHMKLHRLLSVMVQVVAYLLSLFGPTRLHRCSPKNKPFLWEWLRQSAYRPPQVYWSELMALKSQVFCRKVVVSLLFSPPWSHLLRIRDLKNG